MEKGTETITVVAKKDLPTQTKICGVVGVKSPKTLRSHFQNLIDFGYLEDEGDIYVLPNKEDIFFYIPLETVKFLNDTLKDQIVKIYIYLGQKENYRIAMKKMNYIFSIAELAKHIGVKLDGNQRGYETINNALHCLKLIGLIDYETFYEGKKPMKKLIKYSLQVKSLSQNG